MDKSKINSLVAEKIMGFVKKRYKGLDGYGTADGLVWYSHFNPAGDISDAWKVADKMKIGVYPQSELAPSELKYFAETGSKHLGNYHEDFAETGPLAISIVALKSVGVNREELS